LLKSELDELEKVAGGIFKDDITARTSSHPKQRAEQMKSVTEICANLKLKWTHELLSSAKEPIIRRYVQYHQAGITQLSNQISRQKPAFDGTTNQHLILRELCDLFCAALEELLQFLRHQFYQYFDADYKLSIYCCQRQCKKMAEFGEGINNHPQTSVEPQLIEVVITSVIEHISEALHVGISYSQADQVFNLLRMIKQHLQHEERTSTESFAKALYKQNLNTLRFYKWYQEYLLLEIAKLPTTQDRKAFITKELMSFALIFVHPQNAFEPDLPSIDQVLVPWLQEMTSNGRTAKEGNLQNGNFQYPLNLSVPQFALFVRIFYKADCFPDHNVAKLTRFFSEHFTTKKQPHISYKSFARAFYALDQSAAAIVRDYLQKMINYINKTYFP
jgi:hypothetical protein